MNEFVDDLGTLGEVEFEGLCRRAGFDVVRSVPDRQGWDFLVEFRPAIRPDLAEDSQFESRKVLVQVKTTRTSRPPRIKLSAAMRLVAADNPAFIAWMKYSQIGKYKVHIAHVHGELLEYLLLKQRKSQLGGRAANSVSVNLSGKWFSPEVGTSAVLRDLIARSVGQDQAKYGVLKSEFRKNCGYTGVEGNIVFDNNVSEEQIRDLFLGKLSGLPLKEAVFSPIRFGLQLEQDRKILGEGTILSAPASPVSGTINIDSEADGLSTSFRMEVRSTAGLPIKAHGLRAYTDSLEIEILHPQNMARFKFKLSKDKTFDVEEIANLLRAYFLVSSGRCTLKLAWDDKTKQSIELPCQDEKKEIGSRSFLQQAMEYVEHVLDCRGDQFPNLKIDITLEQLQAQMEACATSLSILRGHEFNFNIKFDNLPDVSLETGCVIFPALIEFGGYQCGFVVEGAFELVLYERPDLHVVARCTQILERYLLPNSANLLELLNDRVKAIASRKSHDGGIVLSAGLEKDDTDQNPNPASQ